MSSSTPRKKSGKGFLDSVKTKLTLIIVAIMAIPMIIAIIVSYSSSHKEAIQNMDDMNVAQVNLVEHDFGMIVKENRRMIETVAASTVVRDTLAGTVTPEECAAWLARADAAFGDGNGMVITGADGMQVARASGDLVDVSSREYFTSCRDTKTFCVSDQNISKTTGKRICTFIAPVLDDDGNFIGAVQRNYNLTDFTELVKGEVVYASQDIFIGDNNGDLIAHTSMDLETGEPVNFSTQAWYGDSRSNPEASGSYDSSFNGGDWVISYQREPLTGWVTVVATNKGDALAGANRMIRIIIIVGILMIAAATAISIFLASSFTKPIVEVNKTIDKLSNGEFEKITDPALIKRKDEFGDIISNINSLNDKLTNVVTDMKEAMAELGESSHLLAESADQISQTTDDVSEAVQEIAKGATDQADTIQRASENMGMLSDAIQEVANNAEGLATTASSMSDQSQSSAGAISDLAENMEAMSRAMDEISEGMNATNAAVQSVNERVDGITSIASQTNLLALNASIEAARAGEAGRGFAVVAEEIGKLATESAQTADEIRAEMEKLLKQSQNAIGKTKEVTDITENVNVVLQNTVAQINELIGGVGSTVDGVTTISGLSQESAASKSIIVDAMDSLSAISEENAASTQQTSASMEELNATVNVLSQSATDLNELAKKLDQELGFFKI
ncbi:MAG: methyl-accepting chemotaxis protein [Lachnospiraceae bacterium]|nr:methyl-accepting chemotaxis protein [Lachnospiraceae bacterium]